MSKVKDTFTRIADVYDGMNHALSLGLDRRWRRIAVRMSAGGRSQSAPGGAEGSAQPSRVLDLACGTGDMSLELARAFPDAKVMGVDFTPAMLEIARGKCRAESRIKFIEGDAMALPFASGAADSAFDMAACAWGFRNFPDKRKALSECARVLAPGGRLVVLEFFRPENALLGWLTAVWLRILPPMLAPGRRGAYAYLRDSMRATVTADEFVEMAVGCGFSVRSRRFLFPACTCLVLEKDMQTAPRQ